MLDFLGRRGRIVIVLTLLLAGGGVVIFLHAILFPFLLAGFLSYVLAPVIHRMHQWKIRGYQMPRGMAVILIYLLILFILSSGGSYLIPRVTAEMGRLTEEFPKAVSTFNQQWIPEINRRLNEWASKLPESPKPPEPAANTPVETPAEDQPIPEPNGELEQLMEHYTFEIRQLDSGNMEIIPKKRVPGENEKEPSQEQSLDIQAQWSSLTNTATERLKGGMTEFLGLGQRMVAKIAGSVWALFLTFMVAGFILVDTDRIHRFIRSLVPVQYQPRYGVLLSRLDVGLNGVVRGQLLICLVNGILTMIGLILIGVPFAFTLGLVAMVFSLIPIFGTILSTIPIMIMGFTVSFSTGILALAWILVIHFIEGNFL
ncbi:MAG: AI-2E family transporter, partial [SAR324 cluster bacterium]|nr:AI-2E family transporter [SAR324 cluster bacterium]